MGVDSPLWDAEVSRFRLYPASAGDGFVVILDSDLQATFH